MKVEELEVVVLAHDLPEYRLRAGDIGTVVGIYPEGGIEVEFVKPSGQTQALLTLTTKDIRKINKDDVLAIRTATRVGEKRHGYEVQN
jgi:hypothetical protein